eukprot:1350024-Rhodomonas_salina.1
MRRRGGARRGDERRKAGDFAPMRTVMLAYEEGEVMCMCGRRKQGCARLDGRHIMKVRLVTMFEGDERDRVTRIAGRMGENGCWWRACDDAGY